MISLMSIQMTSPLMLWVMVKQNAIRRLQYQMKMMDSSCYPAIPKVLIGRPLVRAMFYNLPVVVTIRMSLKIYPNKRRLPKRTQRQLQKSAEA